MAAAVRASCTIPFVFQPVEFGTELHVDGGVLSNLPVWLATEAQPAVARGRPLPVVCFQLVGDRTRRTIQADDGVQITVAVVNSMLEGGTNLQISQAAAHFLVPINTGAVHATDFDIGDDRVVALRESGREAVKSFLRDPSQYGSRRAPTIPQKPGYREGTLRQTAELISGALYRIWISAGDTTWLRELQPYLLEARQRGIEVRLLCERPPDADQKRRDPVCAAQALGIGVRYHAREEYDLLYCLVDANETTCRALTIETHPGPHSRLLDVDWDANLVRHLRDNFASSWGTPDEVAASPEVRKLRQTEILATLREVTAYRDAPMRLRVVDPRVLLPLPKVLEEFKLERLDLLSRLLLDAPPGSVIVGSPWPSTPMVAEAQPNGDLVLIDGAHRAYAAIRDGRREVLIVAVGPITVPLPCKPLRSWSGVAVIDRKLERVERYEDYDAERFRDLRSAFEKLARSITSAGPAPAARDGA